MGELVLAPVQSGLKARLNYCVLCHQWNMGLELGKDIQAADKNPSILALR